MQIENKVQEIATTTSMTAAQDFLSALSPEASHILCPNFLSSLSEDVQADLQAVIHSRLLWSLQAAKAQLAEQQRRKTDLDLDPAVTPAVKPALLPQAELQGCASLSNETPVKSGSITEPQPLPVPGVQPRRKHVLVPKAAPRHQVEAPSTFSPLSGPGPNNVPPSQLELPITAEPEPLKPYQRRRGKEPQLTREEILNPYSLSPDNFTSRPADAARRRRRTSIAMG